MLTSYLIANAIVIPISGWLSDVIGRKRYYMLSVALFAVSSLLCGLAPNLTFLILARVLQGIGGGGLAPVRAVDDGRHLPAGEARHGVRGLRHRGDHRADPRADARRLDHRQRSPGTGCS